jgi:hypothetical protein
MWWVVFATILVWLLALLPILHVFASSQFTPDEINKLMGFAPNQFLFILLLPFPLTAFFTFVALRHILIRVSPDQATNPVLSWFIHNWPAAILIGAIFSSAIAVADSFVTARTFDRLQPVFARQAISSSLSLRDRIERQTTEVSKLEERRNIQDEAFKQTKDFSPDLPIPAQNVLKVAPPGFMKIILDVRFQRGWNLLDTTRANLTVLQTFIVLLVASTTMIVLGMMTLASKVIPRIELSSGIDALTWAIVFFAIYPICYRYFVAEMRSITNFTSTIGADVFSTLLIAVSAYFVLRIDPSVKDAFSLLLRGLPFLVVIGPSIYSSLAGPLSLRSYIGTESNWGSRLVLATLIMFVGAQVVYSTWPYPKGKLHKSEIARNSSDFPP